MTLPPRNEVKNMFPGATAAITMVLPRSCIHILMKLQLNHHGLFLRLQDYLLMKIYIFMLLIIHIRKFSISPSSPPPSEFCVFATSGWNHQIFLFYCCARSCRFILKLLCVDIFFNIDCKIVFMFSIWILLLFFSCYSYVNDVTINISFLPSSFFLWLFLLQYIYNKKHFPYYNIKFSPSPLRWLPYPNLDVHEKIN